MKHVKTLNTRKLQNTIKTGGCGECQTSCQSAYLHSPNAKVRKIRHNKAACVARGFIMFRKERKYYSGSSV